MKIIRVGDMHVQLNNIKECEKLIDFIIETAEQEEAEGEVKRLRQFQLQKEQGVILGLQ